MGYITNFIVYTLAMVGVIVVALLVFKNSLCIGTQKSSKYLKIIDSISIGQRKNLFIVSTGKEQFLIAGDVNNTTLISKLEGVENARASFETKDVLESFKPIHSQTSFSDTLSNLQSTRRDYTDKSNIGIRSSLISEKSSNSVMKNLAEIMRK